MTSHSRRGIGSSAALSRGLAEHAGSGYSPSSCHSPRRTESNSTAASPGMCHSAPVERRRALAAVAHAPRCSRAATIGGRPAARAAVPAPVKIEVAARGSRPAGDRRRRREEAEDERFGPSTAPSTCGALARSPGRVAAQREQVAVQRVRLGMRSRSARSSLHARTSPRRPATAAAGHPDRDMLANCVEELPPAAPNGPLQLSR